MIKDYYVRSKQIWIFSLSFTNFMKKLFKFVERRLEGFYYIFLYTYIKLMIHLPKCYPIEE